MSERELTPLNWNKHAGLLGCVLCGDDHTIVDHVRDYPSPLSEKAQYRFIEPEEAEAFAAEDDAAMEHVRTDREGARWYGSAEDRLIEQAEGVIRDHSGIRRYGGDPNPERAREYDLQAERQALSYRTAPGATYYYQHEAPTGDVAQGTIWHPPGEEPWQWIGGAWARMAEPERPVEGPRTANEAGMLVIGPPAPAAEDGAPLRDVPPLRERLRALWDYVWNNPNV